MSAFRVERTRAQPSRNLCKWPGNRMSLVGHLADADSLRMSASRRSGRYITVHCANFRRWLVPAPRYTRDLRSIRFLLCTIQFYDGYAIDLCELIRTLYRVRMRSEETKDKAQFSAEAQNESSRPPN